MPIFEYRCQDCQRRFTALVGVVAGNPAAACPRCGSADIRKICLREPSLEDVFIALTGRTVRD